jgi:hypothetical protein
MALQPIRLETKRAPFWAAVRLGANPERPSVEHDSSPRYLQPKGRVPRLFGPGEQRVIVPVHPERVDVFGAGEWDGCRAAQLHADHVRGDLSHRVYFVGRFRDGYFVWQVVR